MLSRDAELIALGLFGLGKQSSVRFLRPHIITERAMNAINELLEAEMIEPTPEKELPRGAKGWRGTEKIGFPMADMPRPNWDESFNITTE